MPDDQRRSIRHTDTVLAHPRLVEAASALAEHEIAVGVTETASLVGGGGAPGAELPSRALTLDPELAVPLRTGDPAVVGRTKNGSLILDLRGVEPPRDDALGQAIRRAAAPPQD